jgi:phosphoribosylanthranilate isomerase
MGEVNTSRWCKICGVTNVQDAQTIAAAGADAYGLNFYAGSPRVVALSEAAAIAEAVTGPKRVGLFVDPSPEEVEEVLAAVALDILQFHGNESRELCSAFGMPYLKAVRMRADVDFAEAEAAHPEAWAFLLDTYVAGTPGGTGQTFDWSLWPERSESRLILAGGLTVDNVAAAIRATQPFGVDASGGVEVRKGVKDAELVERFVKEARSV